jgi:hypothetical protein
MFLFPIAPITWATMLMTDDKNANFLSSRAIDQRVWEAPERIASVIIGERRTKKWIRGEQFGNTLELREERFCERFSCPLSIKSESAYQLLLRLGVKREVHRSVARSRERISSPGTRATLPASTSASRRPASRAHASWIAESASRLAIKRSNKCDRSIGARPSTSASSISRGMGMVTLRRFTQAGAERQACHKPVNVSRMSGVSNGGSVLRRPYGNAMRHGRKL